jgi:hypothetical protein
MKALFLLCKRFQIALEFTYQFNLIVRRLVCLGDQSRFDSQEFSEEYQKDFEAFLEKYMDQFVGRVFVSNRIRFQQSILPDNLRCIFEIDCHRKENYFPNQEYVKSFLEKGDKFFTQIAVTISENALALPDIYWTQAEFGVLTKQKKGSEFLQFLFPMPNEFASDIFV